MQLKTLLNRVHPLKSFVYNQATITESGGRPRPLRSSSSPGPTAGPFCSGCGRRGPATTAWRNEAVRVRAALGDRRLLPLPDAAGRLPPVRRDRRDGALGRRQEPTDDDLPLVPGDLGQAAELERGRRDLPHVLGQRLSGGGTCRRVGPGAPRPERVRPSGVDEIAWQHGPQVPDARLRHRRREPSGSWVAGSGRRGRACGSSGRWARSDRPAIKFVCSDMWKPT